MKYQNQTIKNFKVKISGTKGLLLQKKIKVKSEQNPSSSYIFRDNNGKKYVVKCVNFINKRDFEYKHLKMEAKFLKMFTELTKNHQSGIRFATLVKFNEYKNQLILVTEYIKAVDLEKYPKSFKLDLLSSVLNYLADLTPTLTDKDNTFLPKKSNLFIFCVFHYYFFSFVFRNPTQILNALNFGTVFYKSILCSGQIFRTKYVISHRDLHSNNIMVAGKKTYLIDLDNCALCPVNNDLAMLPGYLFNEMSKKDILGFIIGRLKTNFIRKQFLYLLIFYFLLKQNTESRQSRFYVESSKYTEFINSLIKGLKVV